MEIIKWNLKHNCLALKQQEEALLASPESDAKTKADALIVIAACDKHLERIEKIIYN